ncbi:MAG: BON domain-containing protein [Acidobacteria bacterium]|nr:BON domain-containing protein [Acidobacteriota bacterium]
MKRSTFVVITLISLVFAPAATRLVAIPTPNSLPAQQESTQARELAYLKKEVRHELLMLPYYSVFDWLEFDVKSDGTVILTGQVTRPTLKSDAENVVKGIEGVESVVNQIEVLPLSPNDDRLRRAVYRTLFNYNSPIFRYSLGAVPSIHIIVKNGHVTLKGEVGSKADADIANLKARSVPGVFSVKNELIVK